jgi:hypothetical protein
MTIWLASLTALTLSDPASVVMSSAAPQQASTKCQFSEADRETNRKLSWENFDLSAERPKTSMWFTAQGCYRSAVDAGADYLARGPLLSVRAQAIVTFHMARNLARIGDHAGASRLAAASRRSDQAPNAPLDWNTYVTGFYAYLIGNRALLDASLSKLKAATGEANAINRKVLERAKRCFDQPFALVETRSGCAAN